MTGSRSRFVLAFCAVAAVGVALRSVPLYQSPLPFNPDGIVHARNAVITARTGHLPLALHGLFVDDLAFGSLLAVVQLVTGVHALRVSQPVVAVVGTLPAVMAALIAVRFGSRLGWSGRHVRAGGLLAAGLLAVEGVYLFRSMAVDEQTPGLFLTPLALVAVVYGTWTAERRWLVAAAPLLLVIPPLHNLESFLVGLSLVALVGLAVVHPGRGRRTVLASVGIAVGYWVYLAGFTVGMTRYTPVGVHQQERLTGAPGLLVAWLVIAVLGVAWFRRIRGRVRLQRVLLLAPFGLLLAAVSLNAVVSVFPGMPRTPPELVGAAVALFVPVAVACWGYPVVADRVESRAATVALFAGPLVLIAFALTAALTPVYFQTSTRTHWFLHVPVMALVGATAAYLFHDRLADSRGMRVALVSVLVLSVVVSIPVAYAELSVYSYQGITTPGEFAASTFAHERVPGTWTSDDHLVRISRYHPPNGSGTVGPVYSWVHDVDAPPPDCPIVTKQSWAGVGAQFYPRPTAAISERRLGALDRREHRVYDGGGADDIRLFVPRSDAGPGGC